MTDKLNAGAPTGLSEVHDQPPACPFSGKHLPAVGITPLNPSHLRVRPTHYQKYAFAYNRPAQMTDSHQTSTGELITPPGHETKRACSLIRKSTVLIQRGLKVQILPGALK